MKVHGERFDAIPRVLHQTWKSADVPPRWRPYRESWRRHHPAWRFVLWTDEDNRKLIAERHPWFLPTYDAFPRQIQRVDAAKYFILYTHGGVYADLDCECLKPVEPFLGRGGAVVGKTRDGVIEGAFLASPAAHPLWEATFREMQAPPWTARFFHGIPGFDATHVLFSTGPQMLRRAVRRYVARGGGAAAGITICGPRFFSGRSWLRRHEPFAEPEAFLRHHYADSWLLPLEARVVEQLTARKLNRLFALLAAALLAALVIGIW